MDSLTRLADSIETRLRAKNKRDYAALITNSLIRNETGKKFESKWFGPYRVLQSHPLGTYALAEPNGHVLRMLINGSRLLEANVDAPTTLWTSSAARTALRRAGIQVERPEEVRTVLEIDEDLPNYSDLSTFTRKEWEEFKRSGARFESVGEELATRRVIAKEMAKTRRRRTLPTTTEQQKSDTDEWNSEANDYESEASNRRPTKMRKTFLIEEFRSIGTLMRANGNFSMDHSR
ncbi:hypothetical protein N7523_010117 [Penicillium sp. IBT 18751x]|nr:hypothetical protein N7523_010117 [Penicillium sp. IBT 18751x]